MSDTRINVPEEMFCAASKAYADCAGIDMVQLNALMASIKAALRWQDEKLVELGKRLGASPGWGKASSEAIHAVRRMFLASESEVPEAIKDAKRLVLVVWPGATEMPDPSGVPSADYCIVRPATKEDWPENKWVQVGPYVSGDPWEATASLLRGLKVGSKV
jgi:hypothetical protein